MCEGARGFVLKGVLLDNLYIFFGQKLDTFQTDLTSLILPGILLLCNYIIVKYVKYSFY